jgi:hypothetical protein
MWSPTYTDILRELEPLNEGHDKRDSGTPFAHQ